MGFPPLSQPPPLAWLCLFRVELPAHGPPDRRETFEAERRILFHRRNDLGRRGTGSQSVLPPAAAHPCVTGADRRLSVGRKRQRFDTPTSGERATEKPRLGSFLRGTKVPRDLRRPSRGTPKRPIDGKATLRQA